MKKESILQADIVILNIYVPENSTKTQEAKTSRAERQTDTFIIIVGDLNTLRVTGRSSRQKTSHNIVELNSIINQLDLTFIKYSITEENTFFFKLIYEIFTKTTTFGTIKHT